MLYIPQSLDIASYHFSRHLYLTMRACTNVSCFMCYKNDVYFQNNASSWNYIIIIIIWTGEIHDIGTGKNIKDRI